MKVEKTAVLTIRTTPKLKRAALLAAKREFLSLTQLVEALLRTHIANHHTKKGPTDDKA